MKINRQTGWVLLFSIAYMVSYITRINYGAVIAEMEQSTAMSRSLLSMAVTGSFITYGLGQIISGVLGDHFSPKKLLSCGFIITITMNVLIPLCGNPYQMLAVWCVNGFAQSLMWPPMVRMMTVVFSEEEYNRAVVKVSWGSSFGTIVVYLVAPLLIALSGWRSVFFFSAACGAVMLILWQIFAKDTATVKKAATAPQQKSSAKMLLTPLMIGVMVSIVLQGILRDGVTTWMPSYISETYSLSSSIAILTGVVLPIFSILCFQAASVLYRRFFQNPLLCAGVIFVAGTVAALGLYFFSGNSAIVSVLLSALLTGCMHGVNLILICMVPPFFKKFGNVSTVSGVINSCTYVGSAISTYGIAVLSENYGWQFTLFIWVLIAAAGALLCLINVKPWKAKMGVAPQSK